MNTLITFNFYNFLEAKRVYKTASYIWITLRVIQSTSMCTELRATIAVISRQNAMSCLRTGNTFRARVDKTPCFIIKR